MVIFDKSDLLIIENELFFNTNFFVLKKIKF